ncbi:LAG1 longevity assurance-like protein [Perilla frutescens var. frutescens]|nr:LAG1 longevity assurance-like protein [Perilla frutescens var. frutescens]
MGILETVSSMEWEQESYPQYGDFIVLPIFAFFFPIVRFLLDRFVFEKVGRRLIFGKGMEVVENETAERKKKIRKFKESAWKCVYFLSAEILALSVTYNEPWFTKTKYFWEGPGNQSWPDLKYKLKLKSLYMYTGGFYVYSIFALIFWEMRRSDFWVSMGHHVVSSVLIILSYILRFGRVGSVVLALHDASDVFMEVGKMSKYRGAEALASCSFVIFVIVFVVLRLIYYPFWILWSTSYEVIQFMDKEKEGPVYYYIFNTLLFSLLVLHIYWWVLMFRMIVEQIKAGGTVSDDVRSDLLSLTNAPPTLYSAAHLSATAPSPPPLQLGYRTGIKEMDDVITDIPPPSRLLLEDLNNFTPPPPSLPSPFLVFSCADSKKSFSPSLLLIAMSSSSLHLLHHLSPKTLIGSLILPEIPYAGNSVEPSLRDKSCNIYALNGADKMIMIILVQFPVTSERANAVARLLIGEKIIPQRVLILDSIQSNNFRGRLSPDETIAYKLETSLERKHSEANDSLVKGLDYYPSGSVVDGLAAALLSRCQLKKIKGTLCVSWPDLGIPVLSQIKSLLVRNVLTGTKYTIDGDYEDEYLRLSRRKDRVDSDLYT